MHCIHHKGILGLLLAGATLFLGPPACRADIIAISTFDTESPDNTPTKVNGWTSVTDPNSGTSKSPAQIQWLGSGGNPNGYVDFSVDGTGTTWIAAPSKFLGNYNALGLDGTGYLSFDHKIFNSAPGSEYDHYEIMLTGANGATWTWVGPPSSPTNSRSTPWVTETAILNGLTGWSETISPPGGPATWSDTLNDVTNLYIRMEVVDNNLPGVGPTDHEGIDNVVLGTAPEPSSLTLGIVSLCCTAAVTTCRRLRKRIKGVRAL